MNCSYSARNDFGCCIRRANIMMFNTGLGVNSMMKLFLSFVVALLCCSAIADAQSISITHMQLISPSPTNCSAVSTSDDKSAVVSLKKLPRHQHFCLHSQIKLKENTIANMTLYLAILASSKVYWDGVLIHQNGVVAKNQTLEQAGKIDVIVPIPSNLLSKGVHHIAIEASNFHLDNNTKSTYHGFRILETKLAQGYILSNSLSSAFILGCLFIVSILFQLLFWLYQRQGTYQIFSLLCLFSACLLLTEKWRFMFGLSYDLQNSRLQLVMFFTFINCLLLPLYYLVYNQLRNKMRWFMLTLCVLLASLLIAQDYDESSIAMYFLSLVITLYINTISLKHDNKGNWANTGIIGLALIILVLEPIKFTEDRFALALFAIIVVMLVSLVQEMKTNRLRSLASVRLEAELLKRNLQPHFLMNSLMLVIEWIEEKPYAAADFVQALSEELRILVKFSSLSQVSLTEEIALCRRHIEIMSYRYNTKYTLTVSGMEESIVIPPAIIHTQIENAFTHNVLPSNANFGFEVIRKENEVTLILTSPFNIVTSTQSTDNTEQLSGTGIGENYIRSRLQECYLHNFSYQSYNENEQWINVIKFRVED